MGLRVIRTLGLAVLGLGLLVGLGWHGWTATTAQDDLPTEPPTSTLTEAPPTPTAPPTAAAAETPTEPPSLTPPEPPTPAPSETAVVEASLTPTEMETETAAPTASETAASVPLTETEPASPSPTPTLTAAATAFPAEPPLSLLFSDDFDSGVSYVWTLGAGWSFVPSESGQALQVTTSDAPVTFVHNTIGNAAVQARFLMSSGLARLSLRQSEAGSYTALMDMTGQIGLYRSGQLLGAATVAPVTAGQWRTLRLSAIETIVRVAVDGVEVIAVQDAIPLPMGTLSFAGIGVDEQRLLVDDVFLWIPESERPSTPTAAPTETPPPTATFVPLPELRSVYSQNFDGSSDPFRQLYLAQWPVVPSEADFALRLNVSDRPTRIMLRHLGDVVVQARFFLTEGSAQLTVRQTETEAYRVSLRSNGQVELMRNDLPIGLATIGVNTAGQWHTVHFSAIQDVIRVVVDGAEVLIVRDAAPLPAGMVTFSASDLSSGQLLVDDLQVWVPRIVSSATSLAMSAQSFETAATTLSASALRPNEQFVMSAGGTLYVFTSDGGVRTLELPETYPSDDYISLSPDGRKVAYECLNSRICIINVDGTGFYPLQPPAGTLFSAYPTWSPDGNQVAFWGTYTDPQTGEPTTGIWAINVNDNNLTLLTNHGLYPVWSGTETTSYLFFVELNPPQRGIYQLTINPTDLTDKYETRLTTGNYDNHPDAQRDADGHVWLTYQTHTGDYGIIVVRNITTGGSPVVYSAADHQLDAAVECGMSNTFSYPILSPDARRLGFFYDIFWTIGSEGQYCSVYDDHNFAVVDIQNISLIGYETDMSYMLHQHAMSWEVDWSIKPPPSPLSFDGRIVYASRGDDGGDIYTMFTNTDIRLQITGNNGVDSEPALSPDGRYVAFVNGAQSDKKIFIKPSTDLHNNDTNLRQLTSYGYPYWEDYPTWSPDGGKLAFYGSRGITTGIFTINADGTNEQFIYSDNVYDLAWSPVAGSTQLLFVAYNYETENDDIYLLNVSNPIPPTTPLIALPGNQRHPVWSADGTTIAFTSDQTGDYDIYIMNADGSGIESVDADTSQDDVYPAWSPDGTRLAFTSYYPEYSNLLYYDYSDSIISLGVFENMTTGSSAFSQTFAVASSTAANWIEIYRSFKGEENAGWAIQNETPINMITVTGNCTLVDAIVSANSGIISEACIEHVGYDITILNGYLINLEADVDLGDQFEETENGLPLVTGNITIRTLDGQIHAIRRNVVNPEEQFRIFEVAAEGSLTLENINVTGGSVLSDGGGIKNSGTLILKNGSRIESNHANDKGGGICNVETGHSTITQSTVTTNTASMGGGIYNSGVLIVEENARVENNVAENNGGGIFVAETGQVTLTQSTIFNNLAVLGGGIYNSGTLTLEADARIEGNKATDNGGGIFTYNALSLASAVVINNIADNNQNGIGNGGGIFIATGGSLVANGSIISGNTAGFGGGVYNESSTVSISLSVLATNTVTGTQEGAAVGSNGQTTVIQSCIRANHDAANADVAAITNLNPATAVIAKDNWWEDAAGNMIARLTTNVNASPMLAANSSILEQLKALDPECAPPDKAISPEPPAGQENCAWVPISTQRYTLTDGTITTFSDAINVRPRPDTSKDAIFAFWGPELTDNNQIIMGIYDGAGNFTPQGTMPLITKSQAGNLWTEVGGLLPSFRKEGVQRYRTNNRLITPAYHYNGWYLVEYYDSYGWMRGDLINVADCGEIPELPLGVNDPYYDLSTLYNDSLVVSSGPYAPAPDPNRWAPFGECVDRLALESSWERCAYKIYVDVYNRFGSLREQGVEFQLQHVLMLVLSNELGNQFSKNSFPHGLPEMENLPLQLKYALEAGTRNIAKGCADVLGHPPSYPISCDIRGVMALLLQVQSIYQSTNIDEVIQRTDFTLQDFVNQYGAAAFGNIEWATGSASDVPFNWGNYLKGHISYTVVDGILNGTLSQSNVTQNKNTQWIVVNLGTNPLLLNNVQQSNLPTNGLAFAIQRVKKGNCDYTAVITTVDVQRYLGATQACERVK